MVLMTRMHTQNYIYIYIYIYINILAIYNKYVHTSSCNCWCSALSAPKYTARVTAMASRTNKIATRRFEDRTALVSALAKDVESLDRLE